MLALAGIYELWHDPSRSRDDPDAWLASTAILTTEARGDVATLHHRMPLTVQRDNYAAWLDADNTDPSQLHALLDPPHERLAAYPVSTAVNNVRANGRHLLERVAAGTVGATGTAAAEPGEDALF